MMPSPYPMPPPDGAPPQACPRCDGTTTRSLPRISLAHAEWCDCLDCNHLWLCAPDLQLPDPADGDYNLDRGCPGEEDWHQRLYGRS